MKTAKIKTVHECKPWGEGDRKVFYHSLEMDNGDTINIGFKREVQPGTEFMYEITGDESQKYRKAKRVRPENNFTGRKQYPPKSNNASFALSYAKDVVVGMFGAKELNEVAVDITNLADHFKEWLDKNS